MGRTPDPAVGLTGTLETVPPIERYAGVNFFDASPCCPRRQRAMNRCKPSPAKRLGFFYLVRSQLGRQQSRLAAVPQLRHHALLGPPRCDTLGFARICALQQRDV